MALDLQQIRAIAERVAASLGLEVVEVEFRGGGKNRLLRVFIDKAAGAQPAAAVPQELAEPGSAEAVSAEAEPGEAPRPEQDGVTQAEAVQPAAAGGPRQSGVTHEDCANLSREMSVILDVEDVVPGGSYTLEVSSPGLDRKLTRAADFARFVGSRVKLMTRQPVNGNRHFEGRLESFAQDRLTIALALAKNRKPAGGDGRVEIELGNVERANLAPEI